MVFKINVASKNVLEDREGYYLRYHGDNKYLFAGWKIHIAAVPKNAQAILDIVSNYLVPKNIPFKFIEKEKDLKKALGKSWSRSNSGKFITIYPHSNIEFKKIVEDLYPRLRLFSSPYILSDDNYKESPIFYRYGRIKDTGYVIYEEDKTLEKQVNPFYEIPSWVPIPFETSALEVSDSKNDLFHNRYEINKVLYMSNAGGTYLALDVETGDEVVLKESRPNMLMLDGQFDAIYYRKIEKDILKELHDLRVNNIPLVLDEFWEWKHYYVAVSYVDGIKLIDDHSNIDNIWNDMKAFLEKFHINHVTLGDISPQNIIVNSEGITSIDFELASSEKNVNLGLPFMRTPGFRISHITLYDDTRYIADRQAIALVYLYMLFPTYDLFDQKHSQPGVLLSYVKKYQLDVPNYESIKAYLSVDEKSLDKTWLNVVAFYSDIDITSYLISSYETSKKFLGPIDSIKKVLSHDNPSETMIDSLKDLISIFSLESGEIYDPSYRQEEINVVLKTFLELVNTIEN